MAIAPAAGVSAAIVKNKKKRNGFTVPFFAVDAAAYPIE